MANNPFSSPTANGVIQPGDTLVARIQNRRGYKVNLPQALAAGELGWCLDTKQLFIGLDEDNSSSILNVRNQIDAQNLIDNNIVEFESKWTYLNYTVDGSVDSNGTTYPEEKFVADLKAMTSNDFIIKTPLITDIISNVSVLGQINTAMETNIIPAINIDKISLITVAESETIPAVMIINAMVPDGSGGYSISGIQLIPDPLVPTDAGLGYLDNEIVYVLNPNVSGSPATIQITTNNDGQGKAASFTVVYGGTGFTNLTMGGPIKVTLTKPNLSERTAKATATLSGFGVGNVYMVSPGIGYKTKPLVYASGGGATVDAILEADWNQITGEIDGVNIVSAGSGYVSAPDIYIASPTSKKMYKFRYHVGFPNPSGTTVQDSCDLLNLVIDPYYSPSLLLDVPDHNARVIGNNGTDGYLYIVDVDANGQLYIQLDAPSQASSLSAIINAISPRSPALAETTQNVEILTRYSSLPPSPTSVVYATEDLITATLTPQALWTTMLVTYPDAPGSVQLAFDTSVSSVQHITFSANLVTGGTYPFALSGKMMVMTSNGYTDSSLDSVEVRNPSLVSNTIAFRSIYSLGYTYIQYKHDFSGNINFKFTTAEWLA